MNENIRIIEKSLNAILIEIDWIKTKLNKLRGEE